ncbi:hypothetical protein [Saccharopolyspora thermophila]
MSHHFAPWPEAIRIDTSGRPDTAIAAAAEAVACAQGPVRTR